MIKNTRTLWLAVAVALAMPSMAAMADGGMGGGMGGDGHSMGGMHHHGMHGCSDRHAHRDHMHWLAKKLGLTDAQKKQMKEVRDETRKTMRPLWEQKRENMRQLWKLDPDARNYMAKVKKLAEKQGDLTEQMIIAGAQARAKFRAILTSEQKAKLKQMREEHRKDHEHRHGRGMSGGGSGGMGGMRGGY